MRTIMCCGEGRRRKKEDIEAEAEAVGGKMSSALGDSETNLAMPLLRIEAAVFCEFAKAMEDSILHLCAQAMAAAAVAVTGPAATLSELSVGAIACSACMNSFRLGSPM